VGTLVFSALFLPIIFMVLALRSMDHKVSDELTGVAAFLVVTFLVVFLLIHITTNVWVSIDTMQRKVFQIYKLLGSPVYRRTFDLSQFERISLHRAFRGGYQATLVGREREVVVSASWKLAWVRHAAEQVSSSIGLKLSDQL